MAYSQNFSPYSRFGLGNTRNPVFSGNQAMGGIAAAYSSAVNINYLNPASYAELTYTTLEIGAIVTNHKLSDTTQSQLLSSGGINHFAMGFGIRTKKAMQWGMSFGILPYSNVKYHFSSTIQNTVFGDYTLSSEGNGSFYKAYLGNGFRVGNVSFGLNVDFLFGKSDYTTATRFVDSLNFYDSRQHNEIMIRDFSFNAGIQYKVKLSKLEAQRKDKKDIYMTLGVYGAPPIYLDAFVSKYLEATSTNIITGNPDPIDTAAGAVFDQYKKVRLPAHVGAGVLFGNESSWLAGADFHYENWKNFESPVHTDALVNAWTVKVGGQIIPNIESTNYMNKIQYKLGAHFGKTAILVSDEALTDIGMTIGLGFPFKRSLSKLSLTLDVGKRGTVQNGLLQENYYTMTIGYTLNDLWFQKRKFD